MKIDELLSLQNDFDKSHGWDLKTSSLSELIEMLHKDLVGLIGELGEFSNHLKKITLLHDKPDIETSKQLFEELRSHLSEEVIDSLIYILRIATHLKVDIEKEYLDKLEYNRDKYKEYEK